MPLSSKRKHLNRNKKCTLKHKQKGICIRLSQSLLELDNLYDYLYNLNDKHQSTKISKWLDSIWDVPKRARLTMIKVRQLAMHRHSLHKQQHKNIPSVYVVEPQCYNKITLLTPSHYMFEEDINIHTPDNQVVGYFHSGISGLAQSGDGGDSGDPWWLANNALANWIDKKIRTGQRLLDNFCAAYPTHCNRAQHVPY